MKKIFILSCILMMATVGYGQSVSCSQGFQWGSKKEMDRFAYRHLFPYEFNRYLALDSAARAEYLREIFGSLDPNEIAGTKGWEVISPLGDTTRWVSPEQTLSYTVYFENDPLEATAAAQVVRIRVPIDSLMDPMTLAVGSFGFGGYTFTVEGSPLQYQTRLDLRDEMNLYVDVVAGYDITRNEAVWVFSSIDPLTGFAPTEVDRGFLAINDKETHVGEGHVTFSIKPKRALCHTGDSIIAQASIIFDRNDAMLTNRWKNTIDAVAPQSTLQLDEETADSLFFTFGGTDDATGIARHRLYYTENNSANRLAGTYEVGTRAAFAKEPNVSYTFFTLAEDNVGNNEPMPDNPQALYGTTMVDVAATILPDGAASVTGTGNFEAGTSVTLTATPATGYRLKRWLLAGVPQSTENTLNLTANEDVTLTVEMEAIPYDLTVSAANGTTITTQAFTQSRDNAVSNPSNVSHFDSLAISLASERCYHDIHFYLNGTELTNDTVVEVTGEIALTSTASADAVGNGVVKDTTCPNLPYTANGFNILATSTQTPGNYSYQLTTTTANGCDSTVTLQLNVKSTHTVTFLANGGSGTMATQTVCAAENSVLNNSTFTNEGFFFSGWATSAGGAAEYADGAVLNIDLDMTLYAVWSSDCVDRIQSRIESFCDSMMWRGSTYFASGVYNDTVVGAVPGGCDSVYSLHLTLRHSTDSVMNIASCQPYTWIDNQTYGSDVDRTLSLTNAQGCDSTVTLHLTISESIALQDELVVCDSLVWRDGVTYRESTATPTFILPSVEGCDTTVTLYLTVNASSTGDTTAVACDSYDWYEHTGMTTSQEVTHVFGNAVGCDSTVTLHLTINSSNTGDTTAVACDSFDWYEHVNMTTSQEVMHVYSNVAGCDSTVTLHLTINNSNTGDTTAIACDSFDWYEHTNLTTSQEVTHLFTNAAGCDSTVTLHLTINTSSTGDTTAVACDNYDWYEHTGMTTSQEVTHIFTNAAGCDSTVTLHLTVNNSTTGDTTAVACDSFDWYEHVNMTTSQEVTHLFSNVAGCDSTVTLHLTVNNSTTGDTTAIACDSFIWYEHTNLTTSQDVTHIFTNVAGCDSTVTLHLTVNTSSTGDTTAIACDSFSWYEHTNLTTSQEVTHLFENVAGCDSTVTLHLTVNNSSTGDTTAIACDSFDWYEHTGMTTSQEVTHLFESVSGCDSTVTLHLTVNTSSTGDTTAIACDSFDWYEHTGMTTSQDVTHLFSNVAGCDSTVTLHLTVNTSSIGDTTAVACGSFDWYEHSNMTTSQEVTHLFSNAAGCDSTVTLHLTVNASSTGDTTAIACDSFDWYEHTNLTTSQEVTHLFTNAAGCDSIVTLHLTVNYSVYDTLVVDTVAESYTWGGNTYTESGVYEQQGTTVAGCDSIVTLLLVIAPPTGIAEQGEGMPSVSLFPNPSTGIVNVVLENVDDMSAVLDIYDANGRKVLRQELGNQATIVNLEGHPAGVYYLTISTSRGVTTKKLTLVR